MNGLYLWINLSAVALPFIFSFHPRIQFWRRWLSFFIAVLTAGSAFVFWDWIFTKLGVWGFDSRYILGPKLWGLPFEEILFFICIPYACIFTYHCFRNVFNIAISKRTSFWLSLGLSTALILFGTLAYDRLYTTTTFLVCGILIALSRRSRELQTFYPCYAVILFPFFIVNGILTGAGIPGEVVWYNDSFTLGARLGTIPVEDVFFGFAMLLAYVLVYESVEKIRNKDHKEGEAWRAS